MSENGEIYTAGKNFTLPPAVTAVTNSNSAISKSNIQARWVLSTGSCTSCPGTVGDSRLTEPGCNRQVCWIMFHHFQLIFTLWVWKFRLWQIYLFTIHHLSLLLLIHFINVQVPELTVLLHQVVTSLISGNGFHPDDLIHFHSNGVCIHFFTFI